MRQSFTRSILCAVIRRQFALACLLLLTGAVYAQSVRPAAARSRRAAQPTDKTLPVLLVSDIHFEPFWDPAKAEQLAAAPASEWKPILASTPSPDQAQRFAAVERACHTRGADTSYPLYASSLRAMRGPAAGAGFVAVSGDLISHAFICKYKAVFPYFTPQAYRSFVEKTVDYVIGELYGNFPGVPVYVALGNNDSDCGDYQLDTHSDFLADTGKEITREFPAAERAGALATFADGGYYSIALPAPVKNARLLVLNDIFMAKKYSTCAGRDDSAAADAQIAWLDRQLAEARRNKQKVWVMGHIPPGVDLHSTVAKMDDVCRGQGPAMFLSSEKMADKMVEHGDVIELAIFAHTHMDELRILRGDGADAATVKSVAVKMVSSISPIDGNRPSFTVAQIDGSTGELRNYKVYEASDASGVDTAWSEEYDFHRSYGESGFTSASVGRMVASFAADPGAKTPASQRYIQNFSQGYLSPVLEAFWPQYVCTLGNHTKQGFRACVCSGAQ